jgi:molybdenum cofactor cytidylyltransferase
MDFLMSDAQPPDAVLLMLADQPLLDREFLNRLICHFQDGDGEIVCTDYGSKKGTPAIFHNKFFSALARLSGEEGAGGLIAAYPASVYSLEGGRRIFDLDTPADFHKLKQIQSKSDL